MKNFDGLCDAIKALTGRRLEWKVHRSGIYLFDDDGGILWPWSMPLVPVKIAAAIPPKKSCNPSKS